MNNIIWNESYSVGNESIDSQHQKIIEIINRFNVQHLKMNSTEELLVTLSSLHQYTYNHLEFEETLLRECNYPDYENHKQSHDKYREYIGQLIEEIHDLIQSESDKVDNSMIEKLLAFLIKWWQSHILEEDMQYKYFFESTKNC